ncbi:MAG TPA: tetratricopeptide repeat protein [Terriglobia bacterium]|nr:tetratricopeptide repeat protein [Terriglobia bacterium]
MYALSESPSDAEQAFFHFLGASTALRHGLKGFCSSVAVVAAAALLAPPALPARKHNSTPQPASVGRKLQEPSRLEKLYQERAARNPQDAEAFEGMAILQVRRGDYADAIKSYRRVLELTPDDHDVRVGLGRSLAFSGQYDAALRTFQGLLQERPGDTDALEGWARVQAWAGRPAAALPILQKLAAHYPANPEYAVGLARVEMNLHQYAEARKTLTALLAAQPRNRDAQLQLAYLDLFEGHQAEALRRFNHLISENPTDAEALQGNARIAYYRGDLVYAHNLAAKIVDDDPRDATALLLLANLERALHHTRQARALLYRAQTLDPRNPEARELENSLRSDSRPALHTSASFSREIGSGHSSSTEDLSAFGYENTWSFFALPRSESFLSLAYLPSQSPSGGIQGAVGPAQLVYRQTIYVTPHLTVRGGVGLARFGPGELATIPTQVQPITSAGMRPLGFAGLSYALKKKLTVDLAAARAALTYTPAAVRLGVMENRISAGLDYRFNAITDLRVEPFVTDASTASYHHEYYFVGSPHVEVDHNRYRGASLTFDRRVFHRSSLAVDLGYAGLEYSLWGGQQNPYIGLFNPGFYQRQYLTTHAVGKIRGPLGFDFSGGAGIQQVEHAAPRKLALLFSPAFTLKASPRLSLTLGYTRYDNSQSLGTLRGNAVRLSTDWRF